MNIILALVLALVLKAAAAEPVKPNIIFILADDLGMGNVSCYGADNFKTPHIDALAKGGMRFQHCYAAPLCGPTRALLMTGRYAFRTGMTGNDSGARLSPDAEVMMPKALKPAGYFSVQVGKWSQLPLEPTDWGFDECLRFKGSGDYWNSQERAQTYSVNGKEKKLGDAEYLPDLMHSFLIEFINRHKDDPFYAYYSMSHVHSDILRTPDSARDSKDFFTDNIVYMDKLVGMLTTELERLKLREKTLIIFAGDNGTVPRESPRSSIGGRVISGNKATMKEGGSLVPLIASWPSTVPEGKVSPDLVDFSDFFPTILKITGAPLPEGVILDGQDFSPQLRGQAGVPREWIFVELGKHWYVRNANWKLNEANELFDMKDAPFAELLAPTAATDENAIEARKRLKAVLDKLNPAGGKVDLGDGSGRHPKNKTREPGKARKKEASKTDTEAATPGTP